MIVLIIIFWEFSGLVFIWWRNHFVFIISVKIINKIIFIFDIFDNNNYKKKN